MTVKEITEKIKLHVLWSEGDAMGEIANFRGADLRKADLSGANLSEANLRGANLSEADLLGANLRKADLSGANLSEANLRGADLREANLRESVIHASVCWSDHGECGRILMAYSIRPFKKVIYSCGCFSGEIEDLLDYIDKGSDEFSKSRKLACSFIRDRINEMIISRKEYLEK